MDNAPGRNPAPYDGLKRFGRAVRDQFGINRTVTLIDAENRMPKCSPAFFGGRGARESGWGQRDFHQLQPHQIFVLFETLDGDGLNV